jgi:hypothetical protein
VRKTFDGPTLPLWTVVDVETFSGVKIRCEIVEVRRLSSCAAYTVKPREDREAELKKAGVPKGDWTSFFTAFDWQVKTVPVEKDVPASAGTSRRIVRKPATQGAYVSS